MQCDDACLERLRGSAASAAKAAHLDVTASSRDRSAGNIPMDPSPISDVRTGVVSIIQEFSGAHELFQKWRGGRAGKRAVGQEECETSLYEGREAIEGTFKHFSLQHGVRFDAGDSKNSSTASGWISADTVTRNIHRQHYQHSTEISQRCR